ncbi:hypothetical protein H6F47_23920 [Sphaerospermopsis sp. FACHB-1094]|uniref:hypothetical protein n=1 Tax=Sphaerospermopsis sp. FACHB-1094 TaxID=2692861 RepID=UPI001686EA31|nr:hypothetical protein [Sphaerospermopsis sp. FACHB-1094]MBD2135384.1 hypothetical protein [Sphaerospermopsis sp. FACHB-1094]
MSESGCPGFKDVQDVIFQFLLFLCDFAPLRLCAKLYLNQDSQDVRLPISDLICHSLKGGKNEFGYLPGFLRLMVVYDFVIFVDYYIWRHGFPL